MEFDLQSRVQNSYCLFKLNVAVQENHVVHNLISIQKLA